MPVKRFLQPNKKKQPANHRYKNHKKTPTVKRVFLVTNMTRCLFKQLRGTRSRPRGEGGQGQCGNITFNHLRLEMN